MENKTHTPLELALQGIKENSEIHNGIEVVRMSDIKKIFNHALPTERQFAEDCFDAGVNAGLDQMGIPKAPKPDFSTFYNEKYGKS